MFKQKLEKIHMFFFLQDGGLKLIYIQFFTEFKTDIYFRYNIQMEIYGAVNSTQKI